MGKEFKPKIYVSTKFSPDDEFRWEARLYYDKEMHCPIGYGIGVSRYTRNTAIMNALLNHLSKSEEKVQESIFEIIENSQEQGGAG